MHCEEHVIYFTCYFFRAREPFLAKHNFEILHWNGAKIAINDERVPRRLLRWGKKLEAVKTSSTRLRRLKQARLRLCQKSTLIKICAPGMTRILDYNYFRAFNKNIWGSTWGCLRRQPALFSKYFTYLYKVHASMYYSKRTAQFRRLANFI